MARFFFHLHDRSGWTHDALGRDLPSEQAAKARAIKEARSINQADVANGMVDLTSWIDVVCADGSHVFRLPFAEAVELITPAMSEASRSDRVDPE